MVEAGIAGRLNSTNRRASGPEPVIPGPAAGNPGSGYIPTIQWNDGSNGYSSEEIRQSKSASVNDGAFWSFMVGTGESSMSAFALALGAPAGAVGLIQTFPQFFGSLVQLLSLPLSARIKSRRWPVAIGVFVQAAWWLPMALLAVAGLTQTVAMPLALLLFTLYFATGMLINPLWASWMAELVEPNERGRYFAWRNQVATIVLLLSTVLGGLVLLFYDPTHPQAGNFAGLGPAVQALREAVTGAVHLTLLQAFAALFILSFLARAMSAWFITRMKERKPPAVGAAPKTGPGVGRSIDWMGFLKNPALKEERRFCLYTLVLYGATYIAAPYFDVYMLTTLHFDYLTWAILSIAGPLARYVALPYWGRVADRFGNRAVLYVTGMVMPISTLLWLFGTGAGYLFVIQMIGGAAWGGLELAAFNYTISDREPGVRTAETAAYNFAKGAGYLGGALVGWGLIIIWPTAGWMGLSALLGLFAISAIARWAASIYYLPRLSEKTFEEGASGRDFFWQVLLAQPGRELSQNVVALSASGMHIARDSARATGRAAKKGLDLTIYMLKRGPLLIRKKKDRL